MGLIHRCIFRKPTGERCQTEVPVSRMLCPEHEDSPPIEILSSRFYKRKSHDLPPDVRAILSLMVQAIGGVADHKLTAEEAEAVASLGETALKALGVGYTKKQQEYDRRRLEAPKAQRVIEYGPSLEEQESSSPQP